jgi:hypothetical protein
MTFSLRVEMPLRLAGGTNARLHWGKRARIAKAEREAGYLLTPRSGWRLPCIVTLTRIAPRAMDGHDNVMALCKHLVDGIADRLGVKDNDPRVTWQYKQARGKPRYYGVVVEFEPRAGE